VNFVGKLLIWKLARVLPSFWRPRILKFQIVASKGKPDELRPAKDQMRKTLYLLMAAFRHSFSSHRFLCCVRVRMRVCWYLVFGPSKLSSNAARMAEVLGIAQVDTTWVANNVAFKCDSL